MIGRTVAVLGNVAFVSALSRSDKVNVVADVKGRRVNRENDENQQMQGHENDHLFSSGRWDFDANKWASRKKADVLKYPRNLARKLNKDNQQQHEQQQELENNPLLHSGHWNAYSNEWVSRENGDVLKYPRDLDVKPESVNSEHMQQQELEHNPLLFSGHWDSQGNQWVSREKSDVLKYSRNLTDQPEDQNDQQELEHNPLLCSGHFDSDAGAWVSRENADALKYPRNLLSSEATHDSEIGEWRKAPRNWRDWFLSQ